MLLYCYVLWMKDTKIYFWRRAESSGSAFDFEITDLKFRQDADRSVAAFLIDE